MDGKLFTLLGIALHFVLNALGAIMAFVILTKLSQPIDWQSKKPLIALAKVSMPIYLLHQQIIYFSLYLFDVMINPYLHAILNFALALSLSYAISALLIKFKFTRSLIGEK